METKNSLRSMLHNIEEVKEEKIVFSEVTHAPKGSPPRYLRRHVSQAASPATRRARKAKSRIDRLVDRHLSVGERVVVRGRKVR